MTLTPTRFWTVLYLIFVPFMVLDRCVNGLGGSCMCVCVREWVSEFFFILCPACWHAFVLKCFVGDAYLTQLRSFYGLSLCLWLFWSVFMCVFFLWGVYVQDGSRKVVCKYFSLQNCYLIKSALYWKQMYISKANKMYSRFQPQEYFQVDLLNKYQHFAIFRDFQI